MVEVTEPVRKSRLKACFQACSLLDENATPPNYKIIFLIFLSLFSSAFTLTFLFPFLPEMVRSFGYNEQEKGYYVGTIASAVFAGRALGSYFWGWLSDKKGRKLVLLLTVAGNGIFSLIFGFTSNLAMAIITRFLTGVTNGTVGTAKTILYEISDDTNQALAMAILGLSWGVGLFLGPAMGGFLASPAKKYPNYFDPEGFFGQFPYLLPGVVSFIVATCVFFVVLFNMPETSNCDDSLVIEEESSTDKTSGETPKKVKKDTSNGILRRSSSQLLNIEGHHVESVTGAFLARIQEETSLERQFGAKSYISLPEGFIYGSKDFDTQSSKLSPSRSSHSIIPSQNVSNTNLSMMSKNDTFSLLPSDIQAKLGKCSFTVEIKDITETNGLHSPNRQQMEPKVTDKLMTPPISSEEEVRTEKNTICDKIWNSHLITLLRMPDVRKSVLLYTMFSFGVIGFEDTFTIWASTETRLDGLDFSTDQLGIATGVVALPIMFLQVFIFAPMARKLGIIKTFFINVLFLVLTITLCPMTHLLYDRPLHLWLALMVILIPQRICTSCCFSATSLLINNSVTPNIAGSVNGIAMTSTAMARALAPMFGGSLFAWSISTKAAAIGPPFDVNLAFFVFGLVFWFCAILGVKMPKSLNHQKKKTIS